MIEEETDDFLTIEEKVAKLIPAYENDAMSKAFQKWIEWAKSQE